MEPEPNVTQAIPFFWVTDLEASLRFYIDGLAFALDKQWAPEGKLRWCSLQCGGAALMLQEYLPSRRPLAELAVGVTVCFQCADAIRIYHNALARGLQPDRPFVGNGLWVTTMTDPDGYRLEFASPAEAPEETRYTDLA